MSSLRLALKQSLQETGHLVKEKKKKPGKHSHNHNNKAPSLNADTTNHQRRAPRDHPPAGTSVSSDAPRKRGRPRKNHPEDGGDDSLNVGSSGADGGVIPKENNASQSESEGEGSESENEFSYNSEEEEEVDDSEEDVDDAEDQQGVDDEEENEKGVLDETEGQNRHDHSEKEDGKSGHSSPPDLPRSLSVGAASPEDETDHDDSDEERRNDKKLFKKHLQQAANKIQAQWKKKAGFTVGQDSDNERKKSGNSSGGLSPTIRSQDTRTNSNSSTPNNNGSEKKKSKGSKSQTVPSPEAVVLEWNRALSEKKCKRHIASGMRVKVCFAAKVKRDGKVLKKKIWYGGRVSAVSKDGSKIRIKYDDGTSEISKFPDKDVVVDDTGNGEHLVPAHKFIPPPRRQENNAEQATDVEHPDEEDQEPTMDMESGENETNLGSTVDAPVVSDYDASTSHLPKIEKLEAMGSHPNDEHDVEKNQAENGKQVIEDATMGTERGEGFPPTVQSSMTDNVSNSEAVGQRELLREVGSADESMLIPSVLLDEGEKTTDIDLNVTESTRIEARQDILCDSQAFHGPEDAEDANDPKPESLRKNHLGPKQTKMLNDRPGISPRTPKLTIRISNVTASKAPKLPGSDSDEELFADTPVTERRVKSIQLKPKGKRKRDVDISVDEQPSKKKIDMKHENQKGGAELPPAQEAHMDNRMCSPKSSEVLSAPVGAPEPEHLPHKDAVGAEMPNQDLVDLPLLPRLENKKDRSKSPLPTSDISPIPSLSTPLPQDAAGAAPHMDGSLISKLSASGPVNSFEEGRSTPLPGESDLMDSLSGARSARMMTQQGKEKATPLQEDKLENKKKKRKRNEEDDEGGVSDASVDDRQWVQCDSCAKWRVLPSEVKVTSLPKHWYCHLNTYDPKRSNCAAPEQSTKQAAKEWRKARKRAKQQRLAELQEPEVIHEVSQDFDRHEPAAPVSPKSANRKKIKRMSPILADESLPGPDASKLEKKMKNKGKVPLEIVEPPTVPEADATKKPGRKRGRPARNQTPQKENDGTDNVEWVQCEKCEKWRKLPPHVSADELPDTWYCKMNTWNTESASCDAPEDKADASHHEVGTFAGMFGAGAGKNSYRALIFGTGKKHNRPMSERARAAESLFMRSVDDGESPCPTVMYSTSSCFMPRTSNFTKANAIDEEKPPSIFDVLSNSDIFAELRGVGRPTQGSSNGTNPKAPMFVNTPDSVKQIMREIVLRSLGDGVLTGDELILTMHSCPWESLSLDFAAVRPYFNADIIINSLLTLVRDGVVEMTSFRDMKIPMGQWTPRYRKVRSLRAVKIEESIKASRCMKISKPWKPRGVGASSDSAWVTGVAAFPSA